MIRETQISIHSAGTREHLREVRRLFREYEAYIGVDLCFQDFEEELSRLPGRYAPPKGSLLIAEADGECAGCVALRALKDDICEMKRLFVRPAYQGGGLGRQLAVAVIEEARRIGYRKIRLDTLAVMEEARRLYRKLGFREIPPYYRNPLPEVRYLEKDLLFIAGTFQNRDSSAKGSE